MHAQNQNTRTLETTCLGFLREEHALLEAFEQFDLDALEKILRQETDCFGIIAQTPTHVFAATDRVRGYPLFYAPKSGDVSFDARILCEGFGPDELNNQDTLLQFCMAGYVIGPQTLHKDVQTLQAGEYLIIDKTTRAITLKRYYGYAPCPVQEIDYEDAMRGLGHALDLAIQRTIERAQGREIWVPLSGGLDSRIILAKLHEHGAPNLKTFSYGLKGNDEAKIAKTIAEALGVPWFMMAAQPQHARALYKSEVRRAYEDFVHGFSVIPSYVEFEAIYRLKESSLAAPGSFIVNGQTGDYLSGGHVPKILYESENPTREDMLGYIIEKHFSIWASLKTPDHIERIKNNITALLIEAPQSLSDKEKLISQYEAFEWAERQAKMVVQGHAVYDYFGFQWTLPLWDRNLMNFSKRFPMRLNTNKNSMSITRGDIITRGFSTCREPRSIHSALPIVTVSLRSENFWS